MDQRTERITAIIISKLQRELSTAEVEILNAWLSEDPSHRQVHDLLVDEERMSLLLKRRLSYDKQKIALGLERNFPGISFEEKEYVKTGTTVHLIHFLKTAWFRGAAAILLFLGAGAYLYTFNSSQPPTAAAAQKDVNNDIAPGTQKATLTLSDGKKIELTNNAVEIIKDGSLPINNNRGHLTYNTSDEAVMNIMQTPRGGQYQLTLVDGTRVWLNAASSITYPTAFTGKTREVNITGEAYFEVAANKSKRFIVTIGTDKVAVLGTAFNINGYAGKNLIKTSLVEGALEVNEGIFLRPGQAFQDGSVIQTDIFQDIAWKNGNFDFRDRTLAEIMPLLERWYDFSTEFEEGTKTIEFWGETQMSKSLHQILKALETAGNVHFEITAEKKVRVSKK